MEEEPRGGVVVVAAVVVAEMDAGDVAAASDAWDEAERVAGVEIATAMGAAAALGGDDAAHSEEGTRQGLVSQVDRACVSGVAVAVAVGGNGSTPVVPATADEAESGAVADAAAVGAAGDAVDADDLADDLAGDSAGDSADADAGVPYALEGAGVQAEQLQPQHTSTHSQADGTPSPFPFLSLAQTTCSLVSRKMQSGHARTRKEREDGETCELSQTRVHRQSHQMQQRQCRMPSPSPLAGRH